MSLTRISLCGANLAARQAATCWPSPIPTRRSTLKPPAPARCIIDDAAATRTSSNDLSSQWPYVTCHERGARGLGKHSGTEPSLPKAPVGSTQKVTHLGQNTKGRAQENQVVILRGRKKKMVVGRKVLICACPDMFLFLHRDLFSLITDKLYFR